MREGQVFLACGLVTLILVSGLGAFNWYSEIGGVPSKHMAWLVSYAILSYHLANDNDYWESARELIENDNYSGAISKLSAAENHAKSYVDNVRRVKRLSLLQDKGVYDNLTASVQDLSNYINSLIENLQVGQVQQPLIDRIDNELSDIWILHLTILKQEGIKFAKLITPWVISRAGQVPDANHVAWVKIVKDAWRVI